MSPLKRNQPTDAIWTSLYKIGRAAALIMAVFIPIQMVIFVVWPPGTVIGWFTLFQSSHLLGSVYMNLFLIVDQVLMGLILLVLYVTLRRANQSFMAIALILGLVGIAIYFALTAVLEMLSPSNQYATATTGMLISWSISVSLASEQAMLTIWKGTPFDVGYVLESVALLIIASVMLQSTIFSKKTAYVGILMSVMSLVQPTVGTIGLFFALGSLVLLEIWDILISRRLFQLGGSVSKKEADRN